MSFNHYFKDVRHLESVDVYRVLKLYEVNDPCIAHAVKKLLCAGQRGGKSKNQDVIEAIASLSRYLQLEKEDGK